jgi:hypothetical protein
MAKGKDVKEKWKEWSISFLAILLLAWDGARSYDYHSFSPLHW